MLVAPHARLLRSAECRDSLGGLTTLTTVSVHTPRLSSPLFMTDMLHSVYDVDDVECCFGGNAHGGWVVYITHDVEHTCR